jgi:hypothetical protein
MLRPKKAATSTGLGQTVTPNQGQPRDRRDWNLPPRGHESEFGPGSTWTKDRSPHHPSPATRFLTQRRGHFTFLKTSTPHLSSSACFPHQPPSSQSGDLVGRGWGLAFRHQQSGPEVNRPSAAENPLLGPQSTSHLRLSPVPTVAAGDGMQVAERLDLSFLSFLLFLAVLDVYDRFTV